mgnify:CR=1
MKKNEIATHRVFSGEERATLGKFYEKRGIGPTAHQGLNFFRTTYGRTPINLYHRRPIENTTQELVVWECLVLADLL